MSKKKLFLKEIYISAQNKTIKIGYFPPNGQFKSTLLHNSCTASPYCVGLGVRITSFSIHTLGEI